MLPTDQLKGSDPISFKFFNLNWIRPLFTSNFLQVFRELTFFRAAPERPLVAESSHSIPGT